MGTVGYIFMESSDNPCFSESPFVDFQKQCEIEGPKGNYQGPAATFIPKYF